ncbi:FGGY family carbohydrate kinase [Microbacterium sp. zg.Y625]|uniref:FGGY-family carbohydrate kinase n=1 Tax=Microbacterium jiangjiandongii TaxID=3049071 RepID=UPI00214CFEFE|nr:MULTISPECIES: FGGY family carbohydrate kinase [unclassified Microbacterium]MCR2793519.1 FGGY family carbohydrate kinase [Microbacterium sp. zg.Y625]WIM25873.1 FGGY family carbohydrate kinase [Microbacterium sp. zg-Y625]
MFLGIDVGTFESKGVLVDRDGTVVAAARRRHGIDTPAPGWVEQDPEDAWWGDVCEIARDLVRQSPAAERIAAVAVSAIGPCVVATDVDLRPLRPAILYGIDTRATAQIERLTAALGEDEIVRRSGNTLTSQSAGPKIAWLKDEEPGVWQRARWFMTSQSWLVAKLTGEVVIDHATAGYFHPLYDLSAGAWDVSGCEDFVDAARLPRIAWTTETAGAVTAAAATITGIPEGTPVIVGTTDSPAEAVGSGVVSDGELMAMYGSSGYFIRVGDRPRPQDGLWSAPFVFEGTYVLASGTSTAGTATRWLADLLGLADEQDELTFSRLIDLAHQSQAGARGVLALPHFAGERTPFQDPTSRGVLIGLGLEHTRADVARAVLEGVGHSIAAAILALCAGEAAVSRVVAIGGATQNPIIMGTVSTVTGLEQQVTDSPGAAYGNAFLAALGVGAVERPDEVRGWVREKERVRPDDGTRALLIADHSNFAALYRAVAPLQHERAR